MQNDAFTEMSCMIGIWKKKEIAQNPFWDTHYGTRCNTYIHCFNRNSFSCTADFPCFRTWFLNLWRSYRWYILCFEGPYCFCQLWRPDKLETDQLGLWERRGYTFLWKSFWDFFKAFSVDKVWWRWLQWQKLCCLGSGHYL